MGQIIALICVFVTSGGAFLLAYKTLKQKRKISMYLAATLFASAVVVLAYSFRLFTTNYTIVSVASSTEYIAIDATLIFFYRFIFEFTKTDADKNANFYKQPITWLTFYSLVDSAFLIVNIFNEIAISYEQTSNSLDLWKNQIYLLYDIHLIFCYIIVVTICWRLISRTLKAPSIYKMRYTGILYGFGGIIILNAVYVVVMSYVTVDFSIFGYSLISTYIYYNVFHYSEEHLVKRARDYIFNEIERGIVLFDFEDQLTLFNSMADDIIPGGLDENKEYKLSDFLEACKFDEPVIPNGKDITFRWNRKVDDIDVGYRCDVKILRDKKGMLIGHLFIFAKLLTEIDLLTGYNSRRAAKEHFKLYPNAILFPTSVVICDIIGLTGINEKYGTEEGDKAIKLLSSMLKKYCPKGSYYARLRDAYLLAVCPNIDRKQANALLSQLRFELWASNELQLKIDFASAVTEVKSSRENIWDAVNASILSMKERKMMDSKSQHSSLLDSLARTQIENDPVTEAHVQRTRAMGEKFGQRIGLTDLQLSHLSLLCLMHDIGKLGIPLEILNKPGKLSNNEWGVMRSHAEKGYKICLASDELSPIAEMVLHHHESWDGRGYPNGLSGEDIPLLSRIISIVDTYDAMTNDRPYRGKLTKVAARAELNRCAGTQFDPFLVKEFVNMLEELDPTTKNDLYEHGEYEAKIAVPMGAMDLNMEDFKDEAAPIKKVNYCKYVLENGSIVISADENFEYFTGYTLEEAKEIGLTQADLIFPEDLEDYRRLSSFMLGKKQEAFIRHRIKRKDGSEVTVNCFGRSYYDSVSRMPVADIVITEVDN